MQTKMDIQTEMELKTKTKIVATYSLTDASFVCYAREIEAMIKSEAEGGRMLAWKEAELLEPIVQGRAIRASRHGETVGFVCLIPHLIEVEICALIVQSKCRGNEFGLNLMARAISLANELYPDKRILLLANEDSASLGKRFGFVDVEKEIFDEEIWNGCVACVEHNHRPDCHCQSMLLMA